MLHVPIQVQPDDESCGPTSLHAIYQYYQWPLSLEEVNAQVERCLSGGTLAPMLGKHALLQGFEVIIYINNLNIFDPSWFHPNGHAIQGLDSKLKKQMVYKRTKRILQTSQAYIDFIDLGGELRFKTINSALLKSYFSQNIPILTGLSSTYLHCTPREIYIHGNAISDDVRGHPGGHFVVLCGYDDNSKLVVVADPYPKHGLSSNQYYQVNSQHLINSIMLGVFTYDANLVIIRPKHKDKTWKPLL